MSSIKAKVDAREFAPRDKHRVIMETFLSLAHDEAMELVNDHDPMPLYYQFNAEYKDQFTWEYVEKGPDIWRVMITKKTLQ